MKHPFQAMEFVRPVPEPDVSPPLLEANHRAVDWSQALHLDDPMDPMTGSFMELKIMENPWGKP